MSQAQSRKRISGGVVHDLPADLKKALASDAKALATWEDITPLARNDISDGAKRKICYENPKAFYGLDL